MEQTILRFFESMRCPALDVVFGVFSLLGEAMVVGGVAILLFWLLPGQAGERIVCTALTSFPLNAAIKYFVARPRPFVAGAVEYRKPFLADELDPYASFPSGHTQSSSSVLFPAAATPKRRKALWIALAAVAVLLVMCARMYFGAHYPSDVITGLALGILVTLAWSLVFRYAYGARYYVLAAFALVSLVLCFFAPSHDFVQAAGLVSGAAIALGAGQYLRKPHETGFLRRLWRIPVGVAVTGAVFALTLLFPEELGFKLLKWFLIALAAGLFSPLCFDALKI